ncbi:hypothetical protein, partial [Leptospira santarosai]|uniref:hypothetical protein n=1 Tax=Leptospira santarosai TaxID=28183 RepID=UPI001F2D73E9
GSFDRGAFGNSAKRFLRGAFGNSAKRFLRGAFGNSAKRFLRGAFQVLIFFLRFEKAFHVWCSRV